MGSPETMRRPKCKACHCFADAHRPIEGGTHPWWCHGCADHCDKFAYDTTPPAPADDATRESTSEVFVYRPASWMGQDPHDGKVGRDDVKWVCRRADDASGAEAMRADFADLLATWIPDADDRRRAAHAVVERIHNAPLPARDDAVEEAMAPGCHEHVALWDAINAYSVACGGHPTRGGGARMDAVVRVEMALRAALRREKGGA